MAKTAISRASSAQSILAGGRFEGSAAWLRAVGLASQGIGPAP
jgi:hypothetical protein